MISPKRSENFVHLPTGPVHYYRAGSEGPPVVLLHGGGSDTARISWEKTIPVLADNYRVYAPDWPKHGGSRPYHGHATQEALERCLGDLLDAWELPRATLVGLSMGGSAATGFALDHPERVGRLVLVDSGGMQERAPAHKLSYLLTKTPPLPRLATWLFLSRRLIRYNLKDGLFESEVEDLDEIVEAVYEEVKAKGTLYSDWLLDQLRWSGMRTNHTPRLQEIRCPTLVIHGTEDGLVPLACAREAARRIPDAELYEMGGCGHWTNRERPEEFNRVLLSFLEKTVGMIR